MKMITTIAGQQVEVTTEHAASSYGLPVVLIDGVLTDTQVAYRHEPDTPTVLSLLASQAGIHDGPVTLAALGDLADEMLADVGQPRGEDYDRVIDEFQRRGTGETE